MKNAGRWIRFLMACASVVAITSVTAAQTRSAARNAAPTTRKARTPPRAADGRPDLQGIWANSTLTPLQRPKGFEDKAFFTEADAPAFQKAVLEGTLALLGEVELKTSGEFGPESGKLVPDRRTSLIIDPPNGAIPPLLPDAQRRLDASIERNKKHPADGPADLSAAERCLLWPNQGAPPMLPPPYNPHIQIFQMDTTNFASTGAYSRFDALSGSDEGLHVIERFTRVDTDTLLYQFTVDDPTAYTRQWSAKIPMTRTDDQMFEFSCHEENYGMAHILSGARAEERAAARESAKKP